METRNQQSLSANTKICSGNNVYTIKKILGSGTFGITYLANSTINIGNVSFDIPIAIKEHFISSCYRDKDGTTVLNTPSSNKEVTLSRKDFITEAKRLQQLCLKSKYIVQVNEIFEANNTAYYVMEYLSGGTIEVKTKEQAISYMLNISEAVHVLHANKILHMDIKPSNIMLKVDDETKDIFPVLIDFGITKHFGDEGRPTTGALAKGATTGYAPIEQYDEVKSFSPTIDIYALGATLFYLLTRQNPPSAIKLYRNYNIIQETLKSTGCDEFIPFITKAMDPNYKNRFSNIHEFEEGLRCIKLNLHNTELLDSSTRANHSTIPLSLKKDSLYENSHLDQNEAAHPTMPIYRPIYIFNRNITYIDDPYIKELFQSLTIAQDARSYKFGILDSQDSVVVPFDYLAIGNFEVILEGIGIGFNFGDQRFAAPFYKDRNKGLCQGLLEITPDGSIEEKYFDAQVYFPTVPDTRAIIHKQTFKVNDYNKTIYIQQIPWGNYGIVDSEDKVLAPFIYHSIEPFSDYCRIPGPGIPPPFLGAKYTIGEQVGYFKILENGNLIDYIRFDKYEYKRRLKLT